MNEQSGATGVFLNGRAQVIEMLQYMTADERQRILKHIQVRNPQLAEELIEKSLTFDHLDRLSDEDLSLIFSYIKPPILGIALKSVERTFQRRLLSLAPRKYAEEAYEVLMTPIANEKRDSKRAQQKVVGVLVALKKRNQVQF
jgi:flagellar motor switch protein FliG